MPEAHAPTIKVIGVGMARTGTLSLSRALEILGFGPVYHLFMLPPGQNDFSTWSCIGEGDNSPERFYELLEGYGSITATPAAMNASALYAAYPDAKFILTTRDAAKWEQSVKATLLPGMHRITAASELSNNPLLIDCADWWSIQPPLNGQFVQQLEMNLQNIILEHNEKIKKIIPSTQLLVYEVKEGWDKLVEFLDVPKPSEPFPRINTADEYHRNLTNFINQ